ncbi:MAG TPA: MBL fold metallo-hydrolase [Nitrososphaeraceae archaeon]
MQNEDQADYAVRINGVLPDIHTLGDEESSERAAEIKTLGIDSNTSCSLFLMKKKASKSPLPIGSVGNYGNQVASENQLTFHLLVDIGNGVLDSLQSIRNISDLTSANAHVSAPIANSRTPGVIAITKDSSDISQDALYLPNALLITHAHDDHIHDLPLLLENIRRLSNGATFEIFCTAQCRDQILAKFPAITDMADSGNRSNSSNSSSNSSYATNSKISFKVIEPNKAFEVGSLSITPIEAYHGENSAGSVIYVIRLPDKKKIIIGWDFLSLKSADESLLWNPDLLILGTQSFNQHPETGMISVTESFNIVREWNAKQCYLVHYRGLSDFENKKNQWFRGPAKPMTSDELQKTIDSYLKITGNDGKFNITVAREGMIWTANKDNTPMAMSMPNTMGQKSEEEEGQSNLDKSQTQTEPLSSSDNSPEESNNMLELEALQKYVMKIEKDDKENKVKLTIEDKINRYDLRFVRPHKEITKGNAGTSASNSNSNSSNQENYILKAEGEKGMLAKGPALYMETSPIKLNDSPDQEVFVAKVRAYKGKKDVFNNEILLSKIDGMKLNRFIKENF